MDCVIFIDSNTFPTTNGSDQKRILTAVNGALCCATFIFNMIAIWGILTTKMSKKPLSATKKLLVVFFATCAFLTALVMLPVHINTIQNGQGCPNNIGQAFINNFIELLLLHILAVLLIERHILIVHRRFVICIPCCFRYIIGRENKIENNVCRTKQLRSKYLLFFRFLLFCNSTLTLISIGLRKPTHLFIIS